MNFRTIYHASTDQSVVVRIVDSTDKTPEEAVEHNTSGIAFWYRREGAAKVAITLAALAALTDAHADGGIEHIDDGYYRLDVPDAAFAAGVPGVMIGGTVTGMIVEGVYVPLQAAPRIAKAKTYLFTFVARNASGTLVEQIDDWVCERSLDGGAFSACANSVVEMGDGWYKLTLATTDTDGDSIALRLTSAEANITIDTSFATQG